MFLKHNNEFLSRNYFEHHRTTTTERGRIFAFRTNQEVVNYIVNKGYRLQHIYDKTLIDKKIERIIPKIGYTREDFTDSETDQETCQPTAAKMTRQVKRVIQRTTMVPKDPFRKMNW